MSRYIDADILAEMVEEEFDGLVVYDVAPDEAVDDICDIINSCPTVDVAPIVHGHWKWVHRLESYECSACGGEALCDDWGNEQLTDYCPHCGAKMDESEEKK